MTRYVWLPAVWRDVDHESRQFGITLWWLGGEVSIGRRLYRLRLAVPR